jgi:C4-dicarboxylate-specific signal transduction histidine kinase
MGQLTASIAHEVNQPITVVRTYAAAALRCHPKIRQTWRRRLVRFCEIAKQAQPSICSRLRRTAEM